jgi:hypothetical protein
MEHQLRNTNYLDTLETLREAALFMYHQYLSQEVFFYFFIKKNFLRQ